MATSVDEIFKVGANGHGFGRQICFFTHYRCFPSEGFYGLGYGDLLATSVDEIFKRGANGHDLGPIVMLQATCSRCGLHVGYANVRRGDIEPCPGARPCAACAALPGGKCWRHGGG